MKQSITLAAIAATTAFAAPVFAETPLTIQVYNAPASSFNVNSTLVMGEKEAVLLDTGFTRSDAYRIAANVLDSGKELKTIVISQADPDYYFGAEVLHEVFPNAKIVSSQAVLNEIQHKVAGKVAFWSPKMGHNAPRTPFMPSLMSGNTLTIEGKTIEIRGTTGTLANRPYVWIPSIKTIAGDVNTYAGMHVWTADSATPALRNAWIKRLDEMKALQPSTLVPGHMVANTALSPNAIDDTRDYLVAFEKAMSASKDSTQVIQAMKQAYPNAAGVDSLELGAKVAKGEMKW
ncbi:MAG: fold metallo-hydrolase [Burkholderiaceae bacterium]|nr:fold metallo-hydrolase [Burkholderiaceae bacterium]